MSKTSAPKPNERHWVWVDVHLDNDPKIIDGGVFVEVLYQRCLRHAKSMGTDGLISASLVRKLSLDLLEYEPKVVERMAEVGLTEVTDSDHFISGWCGWHDPLSEGRKKQSASGTMNTHVRWHVKRDQFNPECPLCNGEANTELSEANNREEVEVEEKVIASGVEDTNVDDNPWGNIEEPETPKPKGGRKRDPIWDAFVEVLGPFKGTSSERGRWNKAVQELKEVGATPEQVIGRSAIYRSKYPTMDLTPTAISSNWSRLVEEASHPSHAQTLRDLEEKRNSLHSWISCSRSEIDCPDPECVEHRSLIAE